PEALLVEIPQLASLIVFLVTLLVPPPGGARVVALEGHISSGSSLVHVQDVIDSIVERLIRAAIEVRVIVKGQSSGWIAAGLPHHGIHPSAACIPWCNFERKGKGLRTTSQPGLHRN